LASEGRAGVDEPVDGPLGASRRVSVRERWGRGGSGERP
jgi:hypothetical protein